MTHPHGITGAWRSGSGWERKHIEVRQDVAERRTANDSVLSRQEDQCQRKGDGFWPYAALGIAILYVGFCVFYVSQDR